MSRLIDADELIEELKGWINEDEYYHPDDETRDIPIGEAIARINNVPTIDAVPVWIPCSERLPEEDGQYLITVKYKHVNESYEDVYAEHGEWFDGKWDMFSFGRCGEVEDIIAWMPLPEPYYEV